MGFRVKRGEVARIGVLLPEAKYTIANIFQNRAEIEVQFSGACGIDLCQTWELEAQARLVSIIIN